ncbi:MAG: polyprenyl synthetase family protein [Verrucomicrobia bacterium]|nr:polyprenyl synthetase family protein [Verrucomicrobiota bacterium]
MAPLTQRLPAENFTPTHPQVFRRLVDDQLVRKLAGLTQLYGGERLDLFHEALLEYVRRPGKRIRPLLFLQATELFQPAGSAHLLDDLVSVATGLELLHAFVLIHDDLIDSSDLRRALPSLHRSLEDRSEGNQPVRTGSNLTIVFGDLLFALAQKCIIDTRIPVRATLLSKLLEYVFDTGYGEIADILLGDNCISRVSVREIKWMYHCKTARYTFECPLVLAGIIAGLTEMELRQLAAVAQPAGLAFQIQNDLKEFVRGVQNGVSDDLVEGKKTLLLRTAYDRLGPEDRMRLRNLSGQKSRTASELRHLQRLILKSGAVAEQEALVEALFQQTFLAVESPMLAPEIQAGLHNLLQTIRRLIQAS